MSIAIQKNGSEVLNSITMGNTYNGGINTTLAGLTWANGTTDYFECWFYHENGSNVTMNSGQQLTYWDGHLVQRS